MDNYDDTTMMDITEMRADTLIDIDDDSPSLYDDAFDSYFKNIDDNFFDLDN
jgi:hypothetical protein